MIWYCQKLHFPQTFYLSPFHVLPHLQTLWTHYRPALVWACFFKEIFRPLFDLTCSLLVFILSFKMILPLRQHVIKLCQEYGVIWRILPLNGMQLKKWVTNIVAPIDMDEFQWRMKVWLRNSYTVEPHSNKPTFNRIPPMIDTISWSSQPGIFLPIRILRLDGRALLVAVAKGIQLRILLYRLPI